MTRLRPPLRAILLTGTMLAPLLLPDLAFAHDCSGPQDCEQTAGYNAVISLIGAIIAILAGVFGSTMAGTTTGAIVAGTTPPPDRGTGGPVDEAPETAPPPADQSGQWQVTDADGKVHVFDSWKEAQDYYERLVREGEAEDKAERIRQVENDYRNAAEQVEFIRSVVDGLRNAGRDASEHERELARWIARRDELRGEVGRAGGDTDYTARERTPYTFGEHDAFVQAQREAQDKLEAIHRLSRALRGMDDKGMVGENPAVTEKIAERLERMSAEMVRDGGTAPSWQDIQKMRDAIARDMDATRSRAEANESDWVNEGALATAREVFTGTNANGETSYKAMALRALTAAASGGKSEMAMEVIEKMYGVHDDVMAGKSGTEAFLNAVQRVVTDELMGRAVEGGLSKVGDAAQGIYNSTLKGGSVDAALQRGLRRVNDVLHTDVGAALRGSGDDVADSLGDRAGRAVADPNVPRIEGPTRPEPRSIDQRTADFEAGRARGVEKVNELEAAIEHQRANPDSPDAAQRVRDAVDQVQADKHAMHDLNSRGGKGTPSETIEQFNRDLQGSYERAHQATRERIAAEYGVDIDDVKVVRPTNTPGVSGQPDAADPRGFARRPDGAPHSDPGDFPQRAPDAEVSVNGEKASFDQDVTYRVRQTDIDANGNPVPREVRDPRTGEPTSGFVDVRKADTERIYNQEFYKARHNGELPMRTNPDTGLPEVDMDRVNGYAHDMDQACTDRLDAEAYGNGDRDLQTAVKGEYRGRDFDDVEGVGHTMEHKQYEWTNRAEESRFEADRLNAEARTAEAGGDPARAAELRGQAAEANARAEAQTEEAFRQTTKQFGNQIQGRVDAINAQYGRTVAQVPPRLTQAVDIMRTPGLSPAQIEARLADIGYTPDKVVQQMSATLESLQKFRPPPGFDYSSAVRDAAVGATKSGPSVF